MSRQNIIGPQLKRLRTRHGLTQDMLAARCARLGWVIGENTVAKIETGVRCISDRELVTLARALRVKLAELLPSFPSLF